MFWYNKFLKMGRIIAIVICLMLIFAPGAVSAAGLRQLTGEVISIDKENGIIVIKKRGEERSFTLTDRTKVSVCKGGAEISSIQPGDKVTVRYVVRDGSNLARSVVIRQD